MRLNARSNTFFREMDALRRQRGRLDPAEIARMALKAGLTAHEALIEIQRNYDYRNFSTGDFVDALALFISSLCQRTNAKRILEYTSIASLLTLPLSENQRPLARQPVRSSC